ncbi:hypothetical protein BC939DRAFT_271989 [Gamsiella multidivaricata]|uniref:uncharacterized protein n=1 Tax=Gamsiella multidivaricata TaxID=101098 RepID=UPI00221F9D58|nr:uncharacterized protein BC939DRAFT_271989 [Gamsiella multidivaricata]KAG0353234.1 hypothetical protein BGZ54_002331 [Gamsiella multidivaricata]KAI7818976.1 hypothetical protein BC939DRAFT_271989 [Gamsiella multidivaricata]
MYAFGALGMSWCEMIAYSGQVLPAGVNLARVGRPGPVNTKDHRHQGRREEERDPEAVNGTMTGRSSKRLVFLWILAGVLYGGIVAGVACQYPKGLYVGSAYVLLLLLVLSSYLFSTRKRSGGIFTLGRNYILQTYLIGGVVAAVAIIIYMAIHHFDMLTSNDKSHLGSITRP